jgi:HlyD family secretion protein
LTASAEIASASVQNALLVPNAALRFTPATTASSSERRSFSLMPRPPSRAPRQTEATPVAGGAQQVYVVRDGQPVAVPVTVGLTEGRRTEIRSVEVSEGTAVITDLAGAQS